LDQKVASNCSGERDHSHICFLGRGRVYVKRLNQITPNTLASCSLENDGLLLFVAYSQYAVTGPSSHILLQTADSFRPFLNQ